MQVPLLRENPGPAQPMGCLVCYCLFLSSPAGSFHEPMGPLKPASRPCFLFAPHAGPANQCRLLREGYYVMLLNLAQLTANLNTVLTAKLGLSYRINLHICIATANIIGNISRVSTYCYTCRCCSSCRCSINCCIQFAL